MNYLHDSVNQGLNEWASRIDIPPHKYKLAEERFNRIKDHLEDGSYPGTSHPSAKVYAQGSYRLGTIVRPLKDGEESDFDIDMVCELQRGKGIDPKPLKIDVGTEVQDYASQNGLNAPENKRRCWTLDYAKDGDGIGFHIDVLPSVPDPELGALISQQNNSVGPTSAQYTNTTIALTDKENGRKPEYEWRSSNPDGYAKWFYDICLPGFTPDLVQRQKQYILEASNGAYGYASNVPDALLRTPLQKAIQILKRHRDVRFAGHPDEKYKPISMIITTLSAQLYLGQSSVLTTTAVTLERIISILSEHTSLVENRMVLNKDISAMKLIRRVGDKWYIPNPVNPHYPGDPDEKGENFADKWDQESHIRAKAFFQWVRWLRDDFQSIMDSASVTQINETLNDTLGANAAKESIRKSDRTRSSIATVSTTKLSRFNVPHREALRWPARCHYVVSIAGCATRDGFRTLNSSNGFNSIGKGFSLRFEAKTNVPYPFDVYWQVVNTGTEATSLGQRGLRGNFFAGNTVHTESTEYIGFHWIECFIVKDNLCVARSGEFIVNIQ